MFIEQALKYRHEWWAYFVGFVIAFICWQVIGSIPLAIVAVISSLSAGQPFPETIPQFISLLGTNWFLLLTILSFAIGLVGLFIWTKLFHKQPIKALTTSRKQIDWNRIGVGFLVVAVLNGAQIGLDYYLSPQDYEFTFKPVPFLITFCIVLFLPLQTSLEEYLFRGYLMQGFGVNSKTKWVPFVLTSVLFGLMHIMNPEVKQLGPLVMVYYIGTGFTLAIMTLMDEGMELSLGYHAGNNMLGALLVTSDWSAIQTDSVLTDISNPSLGIDVFFPMMIQIIMLLFFAKNYKWKSWKEKLFGKLQDIN